MIIVTGSCRTGTSLMMQILREMGIPIVGQAFHDDFSHIDLNPWGYWELPMNETIDGLNTKEYDGMAVKLFGLQFSRTSPEFIDYAIVCRRYEEDAIESSLKLLERDGYKVGLEATREAAALVYHSNYALIQAHLLQGISHIDVDFEKMLEDREFVKKELSNFMEVLKWE